MAYAEALSSGHTYIIRSAMDNNYVVDAYWGAQQELRENIQLYHYHGGYNQQFVISSVGNGWYKIICVINNKAVDVTGGIAGDEVNVRLWDQNGTVAQCFKFEDAGNGYYFIKNKLGYYLDVDHGECRSEANIQTYRKTGRNSQRWLLISVGNSTKQIGNSTKQKIFRKKNETAKNNTKASFVFVDMGLEVLKREISRAVQGDEQSKLRVINLWKQQLSKIDMEKYNSREARSRIQNLINQKKIPAYILEHGVYKYTEGHNVAYVNEENVSMRSQPDTEAKVVTKLSTTTTTYLMYLGEWEYGLDNWICVKLTSGELGWVKRRYVELIPNADFQIIAHQLREEKQPTNSKSNKYSITLISRENLLDKTINKYYFYYL